MIQAPLWSIGVATLASRREKLARLLAVLLPQCDAEDGLVEVLGFWDNGERTLADKRQATLGQARGRYVSFVDDDDMVDPQFVPLVTAAITERAMLDRSWPDYIAFEHAYYVDGVRQPVRILTGLEHGGWVDDNAGGVLYRDITQVNPVAAVFAKAADFRAPSEGAEDWSYVSQVRPMLRTQTRIDRVLYHYFHDPADSNQTVLAEHRPLPRLEVASPSFRWIGDT